ncbi:10720_t:CDS:2, partial [Scutellospora calospora]
MSTSLIDTNSPSTSTHSFTKYHKITDSYPTHFSWLRKFDCFRLFFYTSASGHFKRTTNAWYRTHGYHPPIDVWLVLMWVIFLTLVMGYFGFSLQFIEDDKYYTKEFFREDGGIHNNVHRQKSTWNFLGFLFSLIIIFTSVKVSLTDTSDKRVMKGDIERDMTYARMKGIPVVVDDLMDMTTVEYLSHQQQRRYYSDNYEDEDDENPWRRPYYNNPWKRWIMGLVRK